jgi:hypothetical protein
MVPIEWFGVQVSMINHKQIAYTCCELHRLPLGYEEMMDELNGRLTNVVVLEYQWYTCTYRIWYLVAVVFEIP